MFILVVKHVDQINEALLRRNRAVAQQWQIINHPVVETPTQLKIIHHRRRLLAQVIEGKSHASVVTPSRPKMPGTDGQRQWRGILCRQVQGHALIGRTWPDIMPMGKYLMLMIARQTAVIMRAADFHDLHARIDQLDHRFEPRVIERVGQQAFGRIVRGHQQQNPTLEQRFEQPGDEHRVANVMHVKLVETQHPTILQQLIKGGGEGIVLLAMAEHALMQLREKLMEVQPPLLRNRQRLKETVEQPALATPDRAVQVQARRSLCGGAEQQTGLLRHAIDDALLTVAEGVTLLVRLVAEIIADRLCARLVPGAGANALAEQAAQHRPALAQM